VTDTDFVPLDIDTPGCNCGDDCSSPCYARAGTAPACGYCGCPPFGPDVPTPPSDLLADARALVDGPRLLDYGSPQRNLRSIGVMWTEMLDVATPITPRQVALMLAALKLVRAANRTNRDDLLDLAAYASLADDA
jgi:Domain of unknown function (DUF6378)